MALPGYLQKRKARQKIVTCLTVTSLVLLSGVALTGLMGIVTGVIWWSSANPVARLPVHPNAVRFHLPTLTPTLTPMPTGLPVQGVIATATPPLSGSYQTVAAMAAAAQTTAGTPTATMPPPLPSPTATATQTPAAPAPVVNSEIPSSGGWSFTATRLDTIPARKLLLLYGEMVNGTGAAQQISLVTGTFYNSQGQVIAADKSTYGLWPTNIVPPGGHIPFALTVYNVQDAADFKLSVQATPVAAAPRQDFEIVTVKENRPDGLYCLNGALKNPGSPLTDYLVIVAIVYDEQGKVLRFFNTRETAVTGVVGNQTLDFETCLESPPANIARHQLVAWGS